MKRLSQATSRGQYVLWAVAEDNGSKVVFGHYWICGKQSCSQGSLLPILGNEVVWTEGKHLSNNFSKITLREYAPLVEYWLLKSLIQLESFDPFSK